MVDKNSLRSTYLTKRKNLAERAYYERNQVLKKHFSALIPQFQFDHVHCFLPILKNKEVDTWPLIDLLQKLGKKIVVSKSDLTTNLLTHYLYEGKEQLKKNKWGIPEPKSGQIISAEQLDLVLIPLLVFDQSGHRIGYGKGYYDRFLQVCKSNVIKVGLSIMPPIDLIEGIEAHDIPLDYCITHLGNYSF